MVFIANISFCSYDEEAVEGNANVFESFETFVLMKQKL